MLRRARKTVERHGWNNVHLVQKDARLLDRQTLEGFGVQGGQPDRVLCTLGLSVFPEWPSVFARTFELLASDGRYCVMDLYNPDNTFHTRLVNALASSEIVRKVWEPLQQRCEEYEQERHPLKHGGDVVVIASGKSATWKPRGPGDDRPPAR